MAEVRTISVIISAAARRYFDEMQRITRSTNETVNRVEAAFNRHRAALSSVGIAAAATSAAFTVAFVAMVKASADFEQRMSQVQALSRATGAQMNQLRDSAFTAGKAFGLSATQVADAEIELTKAGVSVKDIIGGALPGALALAAAGQIDVAKATEIASNAMTEFGLSGKDVPHVADLLAAGADKSVASVQSLGDALNQSGLVASQFGLSVEDTVGTLTAFSKAGLNGSDAGTSFKTMLLALASPSKQAQAYLDKYNITAYDSKGAFVGITGLADQLQKKLGGLSQAQRNAALSTIFGTDAIRAANVLYTDGAKGIQGYIDANNEAGFAALQASKKLDNLNGDLQKLSASFQNDLIKSGSGANDVLRGVAKTVTGLLDAFAGLPKPIQGSVVVITGVTAAVTGLGAAALILIPRIFAARLALQELGVTGRSLAGGIGKGGALLIGITALASGLAAVGQQGSQTKQQLDLAAKSVQGGFGNLNKLVPTKDAFTGIKSFQDALDSSYSSDFNRNTAATTKAIDGMTFGITHLSDVYKSNEGLIKSFGDQFASLATTDYSQFTTSFGQFVGKVGGGATSIKEMLSASEPLKDSLVQLAQSAGVAATDANLLSIATGRGGAAATVRQTQAAAEANATALQKMSGSAVSATTDISTLAKTIEGFGSATLDARSATRAFEQAVDDARTAAAKNGHTLNTATQAGRDNQAALDGIASSASNAASKILEETGSQDKAAAAIRKGRSAFIDAAVQMGLSRSAAKKLADQLGLIPANVGTAVKITGTALVNNQIDATIKRLRALNGKIATVYIKAIAQSKVPTSVSGALIASGRAAGGSVDGPGPKGKDSVLAYLAPGEHVLTSKEVDKMGGQAAVYAFRKGIQAFAAGGAVKRGTVSSIQEQVNSASAAEAAEKRYAAQLKAAKTTANRLSKAYDDIDGTKKNAAKKKAAKVRSDAASKKVDDLQKKLDDSKQARTDATTAAGALRNDREDFVSTQRRATPDSPIDPLSYVDQLRAASRNDNYSAAKRKSFDTVANKYEASLVKQQTSLDKATASLNNFKSAADSMRSSITSSIAGQYGTSGIPLTAASTSSSVMRNGIRFTTSGSTSGVSASAIDAYYAGGASKTAQFAAQLQQLANRGVNGALLAEIAQDPNGSQLATALLSASTGQISSINTDYQAIQGNAAAAAGTVTDYNYKALIDQSQADADRITGQIADDGEKLRKLIAQAFGLTGYASGTDYASPGWHMVGEKGPELAKFRAGGQVKSNRWLTASQARGGAVSVSGPSSVTIIDTDGKLMGTFATVASGVAGRLIAQDAHTDSVLAYGGAS